MRRLTAVLIGAAFAATACTSGSGGSSPGNGQPVALPNLQLAAALQPFNACDDLLDYVKRQALDQVGPYGLPGEGGPQVLEADAANGKVATGAAPTTNPVSSTTVAPTAAGAPSPSASDGERNAATDQAPPADHSETNNQEKGVDEPDLVKTDGKRILALTNGKLEYVDVSGATPALAGSLTLPAGSGQLLVSGDHVLVIADAGSVPVPMDDVVVNDGPVRGPASGVSAPYRSPGTTLTLVDIADPGAMKVLHSITIDGTFVSARMVAGQTRVVTSSHPAGFQFVYPSGPGAEKSAEEANRHIIESSKIENWLPTMHTDQGTVDPNQEQPGKPLLDCKNVSHPKEFSGFGMLSVLSLDMNATAVNPADAVGIMADGQIMYASTDNLYVATPSYEAPAKTGTTGTTGTAPQHPTTTAVPLGPPVAHTSIHKFDIRTKGPAVYRASGEVDGSLLNQFSMSEDAGNLRVATTDGPLGSRSSAMQSYVRVLQERDGELQKVGSVGNLGKGEQIKAVRFVGNRGYVVTFRQTDPLYTLDLSDAANPRVVGELKMLGYSAYLHPAGDGLLIGIGQDASDRGRTTGTKVSLYDVADAANPTEVAKYDLPNSSSIAEQDHHAFLWWGPTNLAVLPVQGYGYAPPMPIECAAGPCPGTNGTYAAPFTGAIGLHITRDGITETGRITNPYGTPGSDPCTACEGPPTTTVPPTTGTTVAPPPTPIPCDPACPRPTDVICDPGPCTTTTTAAGAVTSTTTPSTTTTSTTGAPNSSTTTSTSTSTTTSTTATPTGKPTTTATPCAADGTCKRPATTTSTVTMPGAPTPYPYPSIDQGMPIERILVVGDTIYTFSTNGLKASSLDGLTPRFWLAFV